MTLRKRLPFVPVVTEKLTGEEYKIGDLTRCLLTRIAPEKAERFGPILDGAQVVAEAIREKSSKDKKK